MNKDDLLNKQTGKTPINCPYNLRSSSKSLTAVVKIGPTDVTKSTDSEIDDKVSVLEQDNKTTTLQQQEQQQPRQQVTRQSTFIQHQKLEQSLKTVTILNTRLEAEATKEDSNPQSLLFLQQDNTVTLADIVKTTVVQSDKDIITNPETLISFDLKNKHSAPISSTSQSTDHLSDQHTVNIFDPQSLADPFTAQQLFDHLPFDQNLQSQFDEDQIDLHISDSSSITSSHSTPAHSDISDDSDDEFIMANDTLRPISFHGLMSEDSDRWISDLEHYCAFKKLDDNGKIGLVPLLLKDGARLWFDSLPDANKNNLTNLITAFREHYKRDSAVQWRDASEAWEIKQDINQSVEQYITLVQEKALKAKMSEEQTRFSIIRGLLPSIRSSVLQHEIESIPDLIKWSRIAENSRCDTNDSHILETVKRLEQKFDNLNTSTTETKQRSRSYSPHVRFDSNVRDQSERST